MSEHTDKIKEAGWDQVITALLLVILGPLMTILSLNHLFKTNIELSFASWITMAWLSNVVIGYRNMGKK